MSDTGIPLIDADRRVRRAKLQTSIEETKSSWLPAEHYTLKAALQGGGASRPDDDSSSKGGETPPLLVLFNFELDEMAFLAWREMGIGQGKEIIAGRFYGYPRWVNTTRAVSLMLGVPQQVFADGTWSVRPTNHDSFVVRKPSEATVDETPQVVCISLFAEEDINHLLAWLTGPLLAWRGKVRVLDETGAGVLTLLAVKFSFELIRVPMTSSQPNDRFGSSAWNACTGRKETVLWVNVRVLAPFNVSELLGMEVAADGAVILGAASGKGAKKLGEVVTKETEVLLGFLGNGDLPKGLPLAVAGFLLQGNGTAASILSSLWDLAGQQQLRHELPAILWSAQSAGVAVQWHETPAPFPGGNGNALEAVANLVPVRPGTEIVVALIPEIVQQFLEALPLWKFSPQPRVTVVTSEDTALHQMELPGWMKLISVAPTGVTSTNLTSHLVALEAAYMASVSPENLVHAETVVFMRAGSVPLPGAHLLFPERRDGAELIYEFEAGQSSKSGGLPKPLQTSMMMISRELFFGYQKSRARVAAKNSWRTDIVRLAAKQGLVAFPKHEVGLGWMNSI